ncbi:low molecular weight protein-tyrosine-phosphatase [Kineobactrum salinum]|uniref:protein-tyrosine-phosphatase n=1 Tax=Kineobactrum salinum TaxID=2708301 RepID=A0A6C0U8I4_9GAMM|nr:low molecular weight protein-tyrosine-phosphatase [Kineobactrum salinum]QIB67367.1 low molecular weight phosphotyrosine protein phosphatase [Kineobactrum salinum]
MSPQPEQPKPVRVLFVCLGNICRSPTAHGVFQALLERERIAHRISVDSCGTAAWHTGKAPDPRSTAAARTRGYDLSVLRARQLQWHDFFEFDYMLAMDSQNLEEIRRQAPLDYAGHIGLLLDFADAGSGRDVPDPYHGGGAGFEHVLDLVEAACEGLLREIRRRDAG